MNDESSNRVPVLDPVGSVSEIVFGVLMALTFSGTLSVATASRNQVRTMMLTTLFAANAQAEALDGLYRSLLTYPIPSARLVARDYYAARGVFILVVLATFPVVLPFIFISGLFWWLCRLEVELTHRIDHQFCARPFRLAA